ncbi:uncharacterized protein LOC116705458 [Etheostoma spectabile]|uniref:uncharacterized protein LOC116705458 n=1 Tax=Etheostoma spectabile TaxID=54343 RepID=UPI0013AF29E6|nr:uncharacterized protein LOC116705458 [Etheostoma spectabile]
MKNGKAARPDDIPAEALKADLDASVEMLGITLLSVPGKVFNRVLLERMKETQASRLTQSWEPSSSTPVSEQLQHEDSADAAVADVTSLTNLLNLLAMLALIPDPPVVHSAVPLMHFPEKQFLSQDLDNEDARVQHEMKHDKNPKRLQPGPETELSPFTLCAIDRYTRQEFGLALKNKFEVLQELLEEEDDNVVNRWQKVKETLRSACQEVVGPKKHQHKEWITAETLTKIEDRKMKKAVVNNSRTRPTKAKAQEDYAEAHRVVKRNIKKDKKDYIDGLAAEAEQAAYSGNMKQLYDITKRLSGKFSKPERPVKDKQGNTINSQDQQMTRWAEHFEDLLNRPAPPNPPDIATASMDLPINCEKPTRAEIRKAITLMKNGKAARPDDIPAEALKADLDASVEMLYPLFERIWEEEDVPADWKEGYLIKIPKKGDLSDCNNYRGITLLSVPGKVFNRVLLERMKETVDSQLRDEQTGFRQNRSCTDQIATLRIIVEQSLEWKSSLYINFIDHLPQKNSPDPMARHHQ